MKASKQCRKSTGNGIIPDPCNSLALFADFQITIALSELCTGEEAPVNANFARLLSAMMTQVASTVGARPPQPLMPKVWHGLSQ